MKKLLFGTLFFLLAATSGSLFAQCGDGENGFVPLFNGKDLDGWTGNPAIWSVQDGAITGITGADGPNRLTYNQFLIYDKEVPGNFVLKFDFRITNPGNSGIQYRSSVLDGDLPYRVSGYQADFDGSATYSGIVFGEGFRGILAQRGTVAKIDDDHNPVETARFAQDDDLKAAVKIEDWNSYEVMADGFLFIHKINGRVMSVLVDNDKESRRAEGVLAIQTHVGPPMKVQVKNIRIKEIK